MNEYNLNNIEAMKACLNGETVIGKNECAYKYKDVRGFLYQGIADKDTWYSISTVSHLFDSRAKFKIHKESLKIEIEGWINVKSKKDIRLVFKHKCEAIQCRDLDEDTVKCKIVYEVEK